MKRYAAIIIAAGLIIVLTLVSLTWFNLTRMLPQHDGIAYVSGLNASVEVIRDDLGVPHIYAESVEDLFFAQGYVHAQDRWWQMEFQRHTGLGRIQELTGFNQAALGTDIMVRTWGWNRAATADLAGLPDETRSALTAYSAGVNAYLQGKHGGDLALEYSLLGLAGITPEIEPWEPVDTLVWAKVMAWHLSGNAYREYTRAELLDDLGPERVDALFPEYPYDIRPTILTEDDLPLTTANQTSEATEPTVAAFSLPTTLAGGDSALMMLPRQGMDIGSNNWVISGSNTASGFPILANDPHLGIQQPSIWYEVGLHCRPVSADCPFDVVGFSFAGTPAIVVGHNQRIAWGVTNNGPDVQDLYIIRVNPDNPFQYEFNGDWRDMEVITETIQLAGAYNTIPDDPETPGCEGISDLPLDDQGNLTITVRLTHFGPIISDNQITDDCRFVALTEAEGADPLAVRWTANESGNLPGAIINLNRATDWDSFRAALTDWDWPAQNFVYADVDGNIGYLAPGTMPVRAANHTGLLPVPGWTDDFAWQGFIPFDLLPQTLNPERGWIVTANNAVAPQAYYAAIAAQLEDGANPVFEREWGEGYRADRIEEMVRATRAHTVDTVAAIQGDNHSIVAEELLPVLLDLEFQNQAMTDAIIWLAGWDLQTTMDSPQAALFETFYASLLRNLWGDELEAARGGAWATQRLMADPDSPWWDDTSTTVRETRDTILTRALADALGTLSTEYGPDRESWRWGDLHTATFVSSPLGQSGIPVLERIVNTGPVAVNGSSRAINNTAWSATDPFGVTSLPSFRMIVDLGSLEDSLAIHTTGQSGHPLSPHYADMIDRWRTISFHPLRFGDDEVTSAAAATLSLRPAPAVDAPLP